MPQVMVVEGDDLDGLRQHIYDELGPDARIVKGERIKPRGIASLWNPVRYELTVHVPDKAKPGPKALGRKRLKDAEEEASKPQPTREQTFDSVLASVRAVADAPAEESDRSNGSLPVVQTAAMKALADLGVPERYLAPEGLPAFLTKLERAPDLQRVGGSVVVVAGLADSANGTAHQIADKLSIADIVHAGFGTDLSGAQEVRQWRERHRSTTVVCVHVGPESEGARVASGVIAALNPMQVWAVIDARTKAADLRVWLNHLGASRRVDALAARAVQETTQPGTILDLGVPVGLLDGAPANRAAWAAVLSERMDVE